MNDGAQVVQKISDKTSKETSQQSTVWRRAALLSPADIQSCSRPCPCRDKEISAIQIYDAFKQTYLDPQDWESTARQNLRFHGITLGIGGSLPGTCVQEPMSLLDYDLPSWPISAKCFKPAAGDADAPARSTSSAQKDDDVTLKALKLRVFWGLRSRALVRAGSE